MNNKTDVGPSADLGSSSANEASTAAKLEAIGSQDTSTVSQLNSKPDNPEKDIGNQTPKLQSMRSVESLFERWRVVILSVLTGALTFMLFRFPDSWFPIFILAIGSFMVALLRTIPKWQVSHLSDLPPEQRFDKENEARKTMAQIIGGILVLGSLYYTQTSIRTTQEEAERGRALALEGQITDRFTKAVEQLGDEKLEIRLGGIYALERIARDSRVDNWPIMEILTAYIRKNASVADKRAQLDARQAFLRKSHPEGFALDISLGADIQAALRAVGRRVWPDLESHESGALNLSGTYLAAAGLSYLNFENTSFGPWADISGAYLVGARLRRANFDYCVMTGVRLMGALLEGADFEGADLKRADLRRAKLAAANLKHADLSETDLREADLTECDLSAARSLYHAKLDDEVEKRLRGEGHGYLLDNPPATMNSPDKTVRIVRPY